MKLFKTVLILSLAIMSLSSSVAFGCVGETVSDTPVAANPKSDPQAPVVVDHNGQPVNSGTTH